MKKIILLLILFIASVGMTGFTGTSPKGDFYYMHPLNTTTSGLIEIAENVISKSLVIDDKEVTCMAKNIFFEAAVESTAGKLAVAHVTLNRVDSKHFPSSVCEVVYEGPHYTHASGKEFPVRDRCQFSWYCDGKADKIHKKDKRIYKEIYNLAYVSLIKGITILDITDGATHYHADYVFPAWRKSKTKTVEIGDHIFYKWEK